MGALQKIRNKGALLVGVIGLALLFFILGELFNSGGTLLNRFKDKAFTVNGDVITTGEYQDRVTEFEEFQKFVSGQTNITEDLRAQIGEYIYEQIIKEKVLDSHAEKLGLAVTKEELNDMVTRENISPILAQMPIFVDPQTRQFNYDALVQFLTYIKTDINTVADEQKMQLFTFQNHWLVIERMMKYHRLEEKYNTLLASSLMANDVEAKANFEDSKSIANIAYVVSRYSSIADSAVSVTDKEVEKLYNERKKSFKSTTDLRKVTYLVKDILPSQADYEAVESQMNSVLEKLKTTDNPALLVSDYSEIPFQDIFFSEAMLSPEEKAFVQGASVGDIHGPIKNDNVYSLYKLIDRKMAADSVQLQMIFVPQGADAVAAANRADSIISVIRGGKDFATVANELNPQSNGGEVGWVTEPMISSAGDEFVDKAFNTPKGEVVKIVNTGGIQILKIQDITRPVSKFKLALVQITATVSDETLLSIDNELNKFVAESGNSKDFVKAATDKGYNLLSDMAVAPSSIGLPQVSSSQQIVYWAFNEKVGTVKKFDLPEQRVVAMITGEITGKYTPLSEVFDLLKAELIRDKKAEKIIADVTAKNITTLDGYAQAFGVNVDTVNFVRFSTPSLSNGIGREPLFNVAAKYSTLNKVEAPRKGNSAVYVLAVVNKTEDSSEFDAQLAKQSLDQSNMYRFNPSVVFSILKDKADVEDNRPYVFYRSDK